MAAQFSQIEALLQQRADLRARRKLLPYEGTPEIKGNSDKQYLYIRKRVAGKLMSTYVGVYSDALYQFLLRNAQESWQPCRTPKQLDRLLRERGYEDKEVSGTLRANLDFARANMKHSIYAQAVLEGVGTSFRQTEEIIENGTIHGVRAEDVQKILNLKHAWEFVLDEDVIRAKTDFYILSAIARMINEGLIYHGGRVRGVPMKIGASSYVPPIPIEADVKEEIERILLKPQADIEIAMALCLYCMRTQVFPDGNKRAAILLANHYLVAHGAGFLVVPEEGVAMFKTLLVRYYESADATAITHFLRENCWKTL